MGSAGSVGDTGPAIVVALHIVVVVVFACEPVRRDGVLVGDVNGGRCLHVKGLGALE